MPQNILFLDYLYTNFCVHVIYLLFIYLCVVLNDPKIYFAETTFPNKQTSQLQGKEVSGYTYTASKKRKVEIDEVRIMINYLNVKISNKTKYVQYM